MKGNELGPEATAVYMRGAVPVSQMLVENHNGNFSQFDSLQVLSPREATRVHAFRG
jgi:hypothetical protein